MNPSDLPLLNACLNGLTTLLLLCGFIMIRQGKVGAHRKFMVSAFITSTLFLVSYLVYHLGFHLTTRFQGQGIVRPVYMFILFSHIILAVVNLPLILTTIVLAIRGKFETHKKFARWTWPSWMYVSVTGVVVYLMLYVWFPGTPAS